MKQPVFAHHQGLNQPLKNNAQSAKTKKYELPSSTFINIGFKNASKKFWWTYLVPLLFIIPGIFLKGWTAGLLITLGVILAIAIPLFWYAQFYAVTQLPQGKMMFERMSYEIGNDMLLMRKNTKEGMGIQWDDISSVKKTDKGYIVFINQVKQLQSLSPFRRALAKDMQFIFLPFDIFASEADLKLAETVFSRKKLITA